MSRMSKIEYTMVRMSNYIGKYIGNSIIPLLHDYIILLHSRLTLKSSQGQLFKVFNRNFIVWITQVKGQSLGILRGNGGFFKEDFIANG